MTCRQDTRTMALPQMIIIGADSTLLLQHFLGGIICKGCAPSGREILGSIGGVIFSTENHRHSCRIYLKGVP
jgi:hypothetical protein